MLLKKGSNSGVMSFHGEYKGSVLEGNRDGLGRVGGDASKRSFVVGSRLGKEKWSKVVPMTTTTESPFDREMSPFI